MIKPLLEKHGLQRLGAQLERHTLPAVAFSLIEAPTSRSVFGGAPLVPREFEWPTYTPAPVECPPAVLAMLGVTAPSPPTNRPLDFLLQIDVADIRNLAAAAALPRDGLLTFFYDAENQPWGFDPAHQDGFRVRLFDGNDLVSRVPPSRALVRRGVKFSHGETLPHFGSRAHDELELAVHEDLLDAYSELVEDLERQGYGESHGLHRLFGHSANVQGDMQLEAQLVSNGLYCGDASGYEDPRRKELEPGASEWVLLLQLDSDESADIMWGDAGMLYFWIRRSDLAARRFERTWLTLQCG